MNEVTSEPPVQPTAIWDCQTPGLDTALPLYTLVEKEINGKKEFWLHALIGVPAGKKLTFERHVTTLSPYRTPPMKDGHPIPSAKCTFTQITIEDGGNAPESQLQYFEVSYTDCYDGTKHRHDVLDIEMHYYNGTVHDNSKRKKTVKSYEGGQDGFSKRKPKP